MRRSGADILAWCIDACYDCAQACMACADDCLSEESVDELVKCIRLNEDCADVCMTAGRVINHQTEYDANVTRAIVEACAVACRACGDECEKHAEPGMDHRRVMCRRVPPVRGGLPGAAVGDGLHLAVELR